tara:strand:+ start:173 stop:1834 length:1662 start_codon:yes stop_codon:yes gene_type:complete
MNRLLKLDLERANGSEGIPAVISSDNPVSRNGYQEVLVHTDEAIKIRGDAKSLPLLVAHDSNEPQIGKVEDLRVDGGKLRGILRFGSSQKAQELFRDIQQGIVEGISIGYRILKESIEGDILRADEWEIFETSLVGVPADQSTGFYRSQTQETNEMDSENKNSVTEERNRCSEITALGKKWDKEAEASSAIEKGTSLEAFRALVLDSIEESQPFPTPYVESVGDKRSYSVQNALKGLQDPRERGFEFEISQDLERSQKRQNPDSVIIPLDHRAMTAGTQGASTIQTSVDSRIRDFIQAQSIAMNLGFQEFRVDSGDLLIPKFTSNSGATMLATDGTSQAGEVSPTMSSVTLSPKYSATVIPVTYKFMGQSSPDIENALRRLIGQTFAENLDDQVIGGSGSGGNVRGVLNSSIGTTTISGSPSYANVLSNLEALGTNNIPLTNLKYVINPANISDLATAVKFSSTDSPILDLERQGEGNKIGEILGYSVHVTTNISSGTYLLGDFSHGALGFWGGIEVSVNQFYDDRRFVSSFNALSGFDMQVVNAEGFNKMSE